MLLEEYEDPNVPRDRLYVIDKVVRMRALQGRYGVDHSEILNYEFEQANKERYDHMNSLVYKNATISYNGDGDKENDKFYKSQSNAIFERLTEKEVQELKRAQMGDVNERGIPFNEWLRRKDAEKRMKKRLIVEAKNEIRQELFELAQ